VDVYKGAARISLVDRSVGLNKIVNVVARAAGSPKRADNAHGYRKGKLFAKGVSHSDSPVPDFNTIGVAQIRQREAVICFERHNGKIAAAVFAYNFPGVFFAVSGCHDNFAGPFYHMVVGKHVINALFLPDDKT